SKQMCYQRRVGRIAESASFVIVCLFFFQAEDGIRDYKVTGVQTCALPISLFEHAVVVQRLDDEVAAGDELDQRAQDVRAAPLDRSEERRVGKECRSRWLR